MIKNRKAKKIGLGIMLTVGCIPVLQITAGSVWVDNKKNQGNSNFSVQQTLAADHGPSLETDKGRYLQNVTHDNYITEPNGKKVEVPALHIDNFFIKDVMRQYQMIKDAWAIDKQQHGAKLNAWQQIFKNAMEEVMQYVPLFGDNRQAELVHGDSYVLDTQQTFTLQDSVVFERVHGSLSEAAQDIATDANLTMMSDSNPALLKHNISYLPYAYGRNLSQQMEQQLYRYDLPKREVYTLINNQGEKILAQNPMNAWNWLMHDGDRLPYGDLAKMINACMYVHNQERAWDWGYISEYNSDVNGRYQAGHALVNVLKARIEIFDHIQDIMKKHKYERKEKTTKETFASSKYMIERIYNLTHEQYPEEYSKDALNVACALCSYDILSKWASLLYIAEILSPYQNANTYTALNEVVVTPANEFMEALHSLSDDLDSPCC